MEVVGEARSMNELAALADIVAPDVIVFDLNMPGSRGPASVRSLHQRHRGAKIALLSLREDARQIQLALEAGASAYIPLKVNASELGPALLRAVAGGGGASPVTLHEAGHAELERLGLTSREVRVLEQVALGLSNQEIARALWVTEQTVKFHLTNVYRKLRVTNRTEAARVVFSLGVGTPAEE
jgi:DNA-binding NarL/FixJ family response regulator